MNSFYAPSLLWRGAARPTSDYHLGLKYYGDRGHNANSRDGHQKSFGIERPKLTNTPTLNRYAKLNKYAKVEQIRLLIASCSISHQKSLNWSLALYFAPQRDYPSRVTCADTETWRLQYSKFWNWGPTSESPRMVEEYSVGQWPSISSKSQARWRRSRIIRLVTNENEERGVDKEQDTTLPYAAETARLPPHLY